MQLHHVPNLDACIADSPAQLSWRWATELDGPSTQPGATHASSGSNAAALSYETNE
jgi:hypothetical protein